MNPLHAKLIADYFRRPELESMLMDERLAYSVMHDVEKVLTDRQKDIFCLRLKDKHAMKLWQAEWSLAHATAEQRADAFLQAIKE